MNPETINKLLTQVNNLQESYEDVKKLLRAITINEQQFLKANPDIPPGIACKVAFDHHGIIIRADKLQANDIPELQIDHINDLRRSLGEKASKSDVDKLRKAVQDIAAVHKGAPVGTGTKVNFDENGLVVSVSDLTPSDIPVLPMAKIEGLTDIIDFLKGHHDTERSGVSVSHPSINPFTATKITYDNNGHVIKGEQLSMNDLPGELVSKVNMIENQLPTLASQRSVDGISKALAIKLDANSQKVTPGMYTKVKVDSKGLVTSGETLTMKDLPQFTINDIQGLNDSLRDKAMQSDFISLHSTVSSLVESVGRLGDTSNIKRDIAMKADLDTVRNLERQLGSIRSTINKLLMSLPGDTIMPQLISIQNEISTLSGRIATIEGKIM